MSPLNNANRLHQFVLFGVTAIVGLSGVYLAAIQFIEGWRELQFQNELKAHGLQVPAKFAGYQYVSLNKASGDRPVFTFTANDGVTRPYVAMEYGKVAEYGRRALPTQVVEINYLPSDPKKARILKWSRPATYFVKMAIGWIYILGGSGLLLWIARNGFRQIGKNSAEHRAEHS